MEPIRDRNMRIIGYRQRGAGDQINIRNRKGELIGWVAFGQTRRADGSIVSFQSNEGLLYKWLEE